MKIKTMALLAALPMVAVATPAQAQKGGEKIANSYICVFDKSVSRGNAKAEANRSIQAEQAQLKHVYSVALRGFAVNAAPQAIENMQRKNANIAYCEQDQVVTTVQRGGPKKGGGGAATATGAGAEKKPGEKPAATENCRPRPRAPVLVKVSCPLSGAAIVQLRCRSPSAPV